MKGTQHYHTMDQTAVSVSGLLFQGLIPYCFMFRLVLKALHKLEKAGKITGYLLLQWFRRSAEYCVSE